MDRRRPRNPPAQPLVLIVEGHEDTRAMYVSALSAAGFDVVAIEDGRDAFLRAWEIHPDIIVVDLPLPGEGWQILESFKQNPRTRDIPIVAMIGYVQRSAEERVEGEGLAPLFPKHCLPNELALSLRRVLDRNLHVHLGE